MTTHPEFLQEIDWKLLIEQKYQLIRLINSPFITRNQIDALEGTISLIDTIQDYASEEMGLGDGVVFDLKDE